MQLARPRSLHTSHLTHLIPSSFTASYNEEGSSNSPT